MVRLQYASSHDPNMLYVFPEWVADAICAFTENEHTRVFLDQREYDIAKAHESERMTVERIEPFIAEARSLMADGPMWGKVLLCICRHFEISQAEVAGNFPYALGSFLKREGIDIHVAEPLFPERRAKTLVEITHIETIQRATENAFRLIEEILSEARIQSDQTLLFQEEVLTSERLKKIVALHLLAQDATLQEGIIISHGAQAAIPHHSGSGVIKAHEAIVCDIFPRSTTSFYFADMTRTFCKGEPSPMLAKMYQAVREAQIAACELVAPHSDGAEIHSRVCDIFKGYGFETTQEEGFVHSTGHGVGLEIHEHPRISKGSCILLPGDVVTVEPGLYYKEWGGVRIEDMVFVREDDSRVLTNYPKELIIP